MPLHEQTNRYELPQPNSDNRCSYSCSDSYADALSFRQPATWNRTGASSERNSDHAGCRLRGSARGSMTLEMVVILPLFTAFLVFFLFLFRVLWVQEAMEEALVYTARTLAVSCYTETPQEQKPHAQLLAEAQLTLRKALEDCACPVSFISHGKNGISLLSSDFSGDEVILRASYELHAPCPLPMDYAYHILQCVQSRKWIGNCTLEQGGSDGEVWVYVTPEGTVYHRSRSCSYLDLSIRAVSRRSLSDLRNQNRGRYYACEHCGGSASTVYITDYGDRYHSSLSCSGLKRTIYMIKLSQTGGRRVCSKCGAMSQ